MHSVGNREIRARVRRWSVMKSGPVAQLSPTASRSRCAIATYSASTPWPASIVPIVSIVTDTATGTRTPTVSVASSMPSSAALRLSVSCVVSSRSRSTPPRSSPSTCSAYACRSRAKVTPPVTDSVLVVGPIEPATKRGLSGVAYARTAAHASSAAAWLMSRARSCRPNSARTMFVAPKVSVSMTSEPASRKLS